MLIGITRDHRPLRLLREYRGRPAGTVIAATPSLAARLVAQGVAEPAQASDAAVAGPERAVGPSGAMEVRS